MARLQILELPMVHVGDASETPFILVVDEYEPRRYVMGPGQTEQPVDEFDGIAQKIGARTVLVFAETIDIPANDLTAYSSDEATTCTVHVKPGDQDVSDIARNIARQHPGSLR